MWVIRALLVCVVLVLSITPASADITGFIGSSTSPTNRAARGFAIGAGILVVGFEFEYSDTVEDVEDGSPALRTGMGNVLLQTPVIAGFQPYFTTGAGGYREQLGSNSTTHVGLNTGGGVKIKLVGPLRVRIDYRVFKLNGDPLVDVVHRVYAGANLAF